MKQALKIWQEIDAKITKSDLSQYYEKMHYKITFWSLRSISKIEFHRLSLKERKMPCYQNPGLGYNIFMYIMVL